MSKEFLPPGVKKRAGRAVDRGGPMAGEAVLDEWRRKCGGAVAIRGTLNTNSHPQANSNQPAATEAAPDVTQYAGENPIAYVTGTPNETMAARPA